MPKVGKKEFSYDKAGKAEAKAYAKKTGQAVSGYQKGGIVDMKNPMMPDDMQGFAGGGMVNAMNRSQNIQGYGHGGMVMKKKKK
jgi:hypothetical protein